MRVTTFLGLMFCAGCARAVSPGDSDGGHDAACVTCSAQCVSLQCDRQNCGACGNACSAGETCAMGTCRVPSPSLRWARQFHATLGGAFAVATGADDDVVVSGTVMGPADLGSGVTSGGFRGDPAVARYARDGSTRWARRFGSSASDATVFTALALDPAGNVWTAGTFAYLAELGGPTPLHAGSFLGGLLARYDSAGQYRFAMAFTNPPAPQGSSPDNRFVAVGATPDGESIVGGYFEGPAVLGNETLPHGNLDGIVARVGTSGEIRWRRLLGASGVSTVRSLAVDANGGSVVTGIFEGTALWGTPRTSQGSYDVVVLRLDERGEPVWSTSFGGSGDDFSTSVALDDDGNVYLTGSTADGFVAGDTTLAGGGVFVLSLSSTGDVRWARLFSATRSRGSGGDETSGQGIAIDAAGNVAVAGAFVGALDVEGRLLADNGRQQGFAAVLSPTGDHVWSHAFSGEGGVALHGVAADRCGGLALAGSFSGAFEVGGTAFASPQYADGFVGLWQE